MDAPCRTMAAGRGIFGLILAWLLLARWPARADKVGLDGPCEQQLRFRQSTSEAGDGWLLTTVLVSSACAIWMFVFYALHCLCRNKDLCAQEAEKECNVLWEGSKRLSLKGTEEHPSMSGIPALACTEPSYGSRTLVCNHAQQAYACQLAGMEKELEGFLCEVRSRRSALRGVPAEDNGAQIMELGADKLRITVYEIADCEETVKESQRGRKRKYK